MCDKKIQNRHQTSPTRLKGTAGSSMPRLGVFFFTTSSKLFTDETSKSSANMAAKVCPAIQTAPPTVLEPKSIRGKLQNVSAKAKTLPAVPIMLSRSVVILPTIVTDEARAGERGVSPFELRRMMSGEGAYDLGHIPRVVLWRSGWALLLCVPALHFTPPI